MGPPSWGGVYPQSHNRAMTTASPNTRDAVHAPADPTSSLIAYAQDSGRKRAIRESVVEGLRRGREKITSNKAGKYNAEIVNAFKQVENYLSLNQAGGCVVAMEVAVAAHASIAPERDACDTVDKKKRRVNK